MAFVSDSHTNESLYLTSNVPSRDPFTMMAWFYFTSFATGTSTCMNLGTTSYNDLVSFEAFTTTGELRLWNGATTGYGSNVSTNTWYHLAISRSGANISLYLDGAQDINLSDNSPTVAATIDWMDSRLYSGGLRGRSAALKYYTAQLTAAEIQNGMPFFTPIRTTDLAIWIPAVTDDVVNFRDYSGNARDFTEQGTITTGPGPPITWRKGASKIFLPPAAAPATGRAKFLPLLGVA